MIKYSLQITVTLLLFTSTHAQLTIQSGSGFFIQPGATVTAQGDVTGNDHIQGTGLLLLKGNALQNLNMNGFVIPNLEIDNSNHVALTGGAKVSGLLTFTLGKLVLGNHAFTLTNTGVFAGAATGRFAETNGSGSFIKELTSDGNYTLPVGRNTNYMPVQLQVVSASSFSGAMVGGRAITGGHPQKHPRSTDYLNEYWSLSRGGITGGTVTAVGTYNDPTDITGVETDLRAMYWNGSAWSMAGASENNAGNTITAPLPDATGDLYAMNRFLLVAPKVFLQGAYNSVSGTMNDLLRNAGAYTPGSPSATNLLPLSDPYRSAPYNTLFTHVNNPIAENIDPVVLYDQPVANNNIVDWIFIELRNNASPGNTVLQTRTALLQKDGDIVDIDGASPLYFKNLDAGSYTIAVRHRNHLGISTNPVSPLSLNLSPAAFDYASAGAGSLYGVAGNAYTQIGGKNLLWGGNTNSNANVRYIGLQNDKDYLYINLLGSLPSVPLNNVYSQGDLNLNRVVRFNGLNNDKDFLYITILGSAPSTSRLQALPN